MRSALRAAVPLALVAGLITASPAAAAGSAPPNAHVAGGDPGPPVYPSLVQVRIDRTERAMRRATRQMEAGLPDKAAINLKVVRRQMSRAWSGAKQIVKTTPPPPAAEERVRAQATGGAPVSTSPYAAPAQTAVRVLTLQHDMASATIELVDGASGTGLDALRTTLSFTLNRRDRALKDILGMSPPAPPAEADRVRARASGDAPATGFDTLMPNVISELDDELQTIQGTLTGEPDPADATDPDAADLTDATGVSAAGKNLLTKAEAQVTKTKAFVNRTWPPVPADD